MLVLFPLYPPMSEVSFSLSPPFLKIDGRLSYLGEKNQQTFIELSTRHRKYKHLWDSKSLERLNKIWSYKNNYRAVKEAFVPEALCFHEELALDSTKHFSAPPLSILFTGNGLRGDFGWRIWKMKINLLLCFSLSLSPHPIPTVKLSSTLPTGSIW